MITLIKNEKKFMVLKMSLNDAKTLGWGIRGLMLCMHCNEHIKGDIYYPVVMCDTMDKECYEKWLETATNYPEDRAYESRHYEALKAKINELGIENDLP